MELEAVPRESRAAETARLTLLGAQRRSHNGINGHLHGVISSLQHYFTYSNITAMQERALKQENGELPPKLMSQEHSSYKASSPEGISHPISVTNPR